MAKRFILNVNTKTAHDREHLTEECNTDAITKRRNSDTYPKSYQPCAHCMLVHPVDYAAYLESTEAKTLEANLRANLEAVSRTIDWNAEGHTYAP